MLRSWIGCRGPSELPPVLGSSLSRPTRRRCFAWTASERGVEGLLEVGVEPEGRRVYERQGLGVDRAGDPAGRVHPEVGVEQARPGPAARRPHARQWGRVEQQAEAPLEAGA